MVSSPWHVATRMQTSPGADSRTDRPARSVQEVRRKTCNSGSLTHSPSFANLAEHRVARSIGGLGGAEQGRLKPVSQSDDAG